MTSQILNGCFGASRALAGRGLCSSLLVLLALGAVPSMGWSACDYTVTSSGDSGGVCTGTPSGCTLRQAISDANATTSAKTICFAESMKGNTITLQTTLPNILYSLNILGFGSLNSSNAITISGNNTLRIVTVNLSSPLTDEVVFDGLIFSNGRNLAASDGGAIRITKGALTVKNSTIQNCIVGRDGGGIANVSVNQLKVKNTTFTGNSASRGGAIYSTGSLSIENSTFNGNVASDSGGAVYGAEMSVVNSTFSDNSYGSNDVTNHGGAIFLSNPLSSTLYNSILANSSGGSGANEDCSASGDPISIYANNIIEKDDSINPCQTGGSGPDPGLGSLGYYGGPTQTMAINSSSPAYNAGDNAKCLTTDQRGVTRPQYSTCDIGAFELSNRIGSTNYLKAIAKGQYTTPCSGAVGIPDTQWPQLSLQGVCWAYITLESQTASTLSNITYRVSNISNGNWILNSDTIPGQVGSVVQVIPTGPYGGENNPTTLSSIGQRTKAWFKVGMMQAGSYTIGLQILGTDPAGPTTLLSVRPGQSKRLRELGALTVEFDPQNGSTEAVVDSDPVSDSESSGGLLRAIRN